MRQYAAIIAIGSTARNTALAAAPNHSERLPELDPSERVATSRA
jgi:hypothetical protein